MVTLSVWICQHIKHSKVTSFVGVDVKLFASIQPLSAEDMWNVEGVD